MSDSTWICITPSPSLGWSFGNMVLPRFVSMWQEILNISCHIDTNFKKTYEWFDWLFAWKWFHGQDWCFNHTLQYFYHNIARTDFTSDNRSGRARARDAFYYFNDAYCRPVTSAHESWPRRSPYRHGAPSPSFVLCPPWADRRFLLRPAAEPMTYSGRPPRPRPHRRSSSAVQPRDVSLILTHSERHPAE